jgi:GH18 family chitinase
MSINWTRTSRLLCSTAILALLSCQTDITPGSTSSLPNVGTSVGSNMSNTANGSSSQSTGNGARVRAAYLPDYGVSASNIVILWDQFNLLRAFAITLNTDGTIKKNPLKDAIYFEYVKTAQSKGIPVTITVGGGGQSAALVGVAASATKRKVFNDEIKAVLAQYSLKGLVIDWEFPEAGDKINFEVWIKELKVALGSAYTLGVSVPTLDHGQRSNFSDALLSTVDEIEVMAYDYNNCIPGRVYTVLADLSTFAKTSQTLNYWKTTRNVPGSKILLGLPTYGNAYYKDSQVATGLTCFTQMGASYYEGSRDGADTVVLTPEPERTQKAQLVKDQNLKGVMYWELTQDGVASWSMVSEYNRKLKALGL